MFSTILSQDRKVLEGSTVALTSTNAAVIARFNYGPHGEPLNFNPATAATPFLYNGKFGVQTDKNGLVYMRARYYAPYIGRFVNQIHFSGALTQGVTLNRYSFANDDPINNIDPEGRFAKGVPAGWNGNISPRVPTSRGYSCQTYLFLCSLSSAPPTLLLYLQ